MDDLFTFIDKHASQFESDLCELLRIASVSADSKFHSEVRRAAQWVAGHLQEMGLGTELIETIGHPLVFAETPDVPGAPTVLVYGHYDVQPPDPLDQWISPPFEPTRRNGNLYARGATDDKGQMFTHLASVQSWLAVRGKLPVKIKFLIEGEEEWGSKGINDFLHKPDARLKLASDVCVISDTCQFGPGQPAITYGLRGIVGFELTLTGPRQDLHSGTFGGAVTNPVNALCKMLAAVRDEQGRVQIPGFYDDVLPLTDRERQQLARLLFKDAEFIKQLGVTGLSGEEGFSTLERRWCRPTFDINGVYGGYQGEGGKTIIPAKAVAKFTFRLVPRQDPDKIAKALEQFLRPLCPPGITMDLVHQHGAQGVVVPLDSPYMEAAARAIERGFGKAPVFIREGGSIPIVTAFAQRLGVDTLLLGWGLDDDSTHSPNEKFCLADFHRGIKASAALWEELGHLRRP
jgi:acetylornithine deacetylase/succinyl-diaminopimelate desuccinylase-like protein